MRQPNYLVPWRPGFLPPPVYYHQHPVFRAAPPPPGYSRSLFLAPPLLLPPPPANVYRPVFDDRSRRLYYVLNPLKRPTSTSHQKPGQKKPRTVDIGLETKAIEITTASSLSPPSPTSLAPPSPPLTSSEPPSPPASPGPQTPTSPVTPMSARPGSPPQPQLALPAVPKLTELQHHTLPSAEITPSAPPASATSPVPVLPPPLLIQDSPPQLPKLVPEQTQPTEQKKTSPLVSWLSNFDSECRKQVVLDEAENRCANSDGCPQNAQDMVRPTLEVSGNSWEAPLEIPSSPEETKPNITRLSRLKRPRDSANLKLSNLSQERMTLVTQVVSLLVFELANSSDVNQMINLANGAFAYFNTLEVNYLPLYREVHALISYQHDKEALEIEKTGPAFVTRTHFLKLKAILSDAELAKSRALTKVENVKHKLVPLRARFEEIREQLRKAEKALAEGEAELADAEAEKVLSDEAHFMAEEEIRKISGEMNKAKVVIDEVDRHWREAMDGIQRTRDVLLVLRK